ncbi:2-hydroxyacylsphingosine 1-beta-galactosyltransferase-like [Glandiceps talaboti]
MAPEYKCSQRIAICCILAMLFQNMSCSNILLLPGFPHGSHFLFMAKIGEHLAEKGHNVTLLLGETKHDLEKTPRRETIFKFEKYQTKLDEDFKREAAQPFMRKALKGQFTYTDLSVVFDAMFNECTAIMENGHLLGRLMKNKFDLIVFDNFQLCNFMIVQKLSIPFVVASTNRPMVPVDAYHLGMPSPLSYVPFMTSALTDRMNFLQRLTNMAGTAVGLYFFNFVILPKFDDLKQKHNILPEVSMTESIGTAEFNLFSVSWALEFPRPTMPNMAFIGGLLAKPASPLNKELEDFVQSAKHGIVVLTFGTELNPGSDMEVAEMLTAAFARLPQKVIMRYEGEPPKSLGNNTMLTKWMPQNDLLGHPQTKAFVTHGGLNGVYEAIFHGVPVVGLPLYGDQFDNMARLTSKGMAVSVDIGTLTSDELYEAIKTVVENPSYKENAVRLSRIHRDQPMSPGDTTVFWIEHVIKHGGGHLRAEAFNLNFFQYFMLDVMVVLVVIILAIIIIVIKTLTIICRSLFKRNANKEKQS